MLSPILKDLSGDMGDALRILKVDVDKHPRVANKYGVYSVPTIILFQDGHILWKGSGARPKEELKRIIHGAVKMKDAV
jgi:thioredoxin 1